MENSNLSSEELADEAAAAAVPTPVELNEELNEVYQSATPTSMPRCGSWLWAPSLLRIPA